MKKILVLFFILMNNNHVGYAQKLGENSSFSAKYNWMESQYLRDQTRKRIPQESFVSYNKENSYITIKSFDNVKSFKVKNFRLEYVGKEQLNCMNVVSSNILGEEEIVGVVWWDESRCAFASLGGDKVIVYYNISDSNFYF